MDDQKEQFLSFLTIEKILENNERNIIVIINEIQTEVS
jgi:hypothetical protein